MNQEQQVEELRKKKLLAKIFNDAIENYSRGLKNIQKEINKYPKCKHCRISFVAHQLHHLSKDELKSIEEQEEQEQENDSCNSRFNEDDLYCNDCIFKALHPIIPLKIFEYILLKIKIKYTVKLNKQNAFYDS